MRQRYIAFNGPSPTTAAQAKLSTGTSIKTHVQVGVPSTNQIEIVEWGVSFDASALATPIQCELLQTDVAATVTSLTPTLYGDPNAPLSACVGGTALTGYNASAEGTITAVRMFDAQSVEPIGGYFKQFPLGERPIVAVSKFLRVRITAAASVLAYAYVIWAE